MHKQYDLDLPTDVVSTPGEVSATPAEDVPWWRPSWKEATRHLGWRWIFIAPAVLTLGLLIASVFLIPLRAVLVVVGIKLAVFAVAVALSMAGYVIKVAARARKDPFCIHCGYNLTGLPDNYRCPECGRPYSLRLIEEYRRDPQWFIERWKLHHRLGLAEAPFDAGPVRRESGDGT